MSEASNGQTPGPIIYIVASGPFVRIGVAEDPAAEVAKMQAGSPTPIEIVAGCTVPTIGRVALLADLVRVFRIKSPGQWFKQNSAKAAKTLGYFAELHGGRPWRVRKRPQPVEPAPQGRLRPVITPLGRFPSANAAAKALGISRQRAHANATRRSKGWRFEDDDSPPPARKRMGRPPRPPGSEPGPYTKNPDEPRWQTDK